jgi:hypothetical protein
VAESKIISRTTNSNYGSDHWFNTLISRQKTVAEILRSSQCTEAQLLSMANCLYETTHELIEGWNIRQLEIEEMEKKLKLPQAK